MIYPVVLPVEIARKLSRKLVGPMEASTGDSARGGAAVGRGKRIRPRVLSVSLGRMGGSA